MYSSVQARPRKRNSAHTVSTHGETQIEGLSARGSGARPDIGVAICNGGGDVAKRGARAVALLVDSVIGQGNGTLCGFEMLIWFWLWKWVDGLLPGVGGYVLLVVVINYRGEGLRW